MQHGKRADAIIKSMLLHSGESSRQHRFTDINALVEESLNRAYYGERAEPRGFTIKLERSFDPAAGEAELFPREITRALLNLISNGFYAAAKRKAETKGGHLEPTLAAATKKLGAHVEIRIRDNGAGIPADVKGEDVRSILHDETCRRRHRTWALHQSRHHRQATWRLDRGRYEGRRIRGNQGHFAARLRICLMSAIGTKRTCRVALHMSALGGKRHDFD